MDFTENALVLLEDAILREDYPFPNEGQDIIGIEDEGRERRLSLGFLESQVARERFKLFLESLKSINFEMEALSTFLFKGYQRIDDDNVLELSGAVDGVYELLLRGEHGGLSVYFMRDTDEDGHKDGYVLIMSVSADLWFVPEGEPKPSQHCVSFEFGDRDTFVSSKWGTFETGIESDSNGDWILYER